MEAAIENALKKLDLTRDQVDVEVLSEGGFLKPCKVAVSKKMTDGEKVQNFIETLFEKMHFDECVVQIEEKSDVVNVNVVTTDQGSVIGYRGEVLDAIQYLTTLVMGTEDKSFKRVVVDCEGYRAKREKTLVQLAKNLEQKVKRTGRPAKLEPMNPYERRIIHTALQDSKYVSTESEGVMNNRHVVVSPKLSGDILNAPTGSRKTLNFVYRSEKKRRR